VTTFLFEFICSGRTTLHDVEVAGSIHGRVKNATTYDL
jgi:hypothetical protein